MNGEPHHSHVTLLIVIILALLIGVGYYLVAFQKSAPVAEPQPAPVQPIATTTVQPDLKALSASSTPQSPAQETKQQKQLDALKASSTSTSTTNSSILDQLKAK